MLRKYFQRTEKHTPWYLLVAFGFCILFTGDMLVFVTAAHSKAAHRTLHHITPFHFKKIPTNTPHPSAPRVVHDDPAAAREIAGAQRTFDASVRSQRTQADLEGFAGPVPQKVAEEASLLPTKPSGSLAKAPQLSIAPQKLKNALLSKVDQALAQNKDPAMFQSLMKLKSQISSAQDPSSLMEHMHTLQGLTGENLDIASLVPTDVSNYVGKAEDTLKGLAGGAGFSQAGSQQGNTVNQEVQQLEQVLQELQDTQRKLGGGQQGIYPQAQALDQHAQRLESQAQGFLGQDSPNDIKGPGTPIGKGTQKSDSSSWGGF